MEKMPMGKGKTNKLSILLKGLGRSGSLSPPSSPPSKKVSSSSFCFSPPIHPPSPKWARAADLDDDQEVSSGRMHKSRVAPEGCFSVYVGDERKRFVVKTEHANHPLFRTLLEEAESEYGFADGPIVLPCAVDVFRHVLWEIDADDVVARPRGCAFSPRRGGTGGGLEGYQVLSPSRFRVG